MNNVFIIGNGFDLSHGFNTDYKTFVVNYILKCLYRCLEKEKIEDDYKVYFVYSDCLIDVKIGFFTSSISNQREELKRIFDRVKRDINSFQDLENWIKSQGKITIDYKKSLFYKINTHLTEFNWVDIENLYFKELISIIKEGKTEQVINELITKLNNELNEIKQELVNYLKSESKNIEFFFTKEDPNILSLRSSFHDIISLNNQTNTQTLIINFNYTKTLEYYNKELGNNITVVHIHGQIEENPTDIIFGYGDDKDEEYKTILIPFKGVDRLKNIKQKMYSEVESFPIITNFLEKGKYEVNVIGHSCGYSDRYILSRVFGNLNCSKINLYTYFFTEELNDFETKSSSIFDCLNDNPDKFSQLLRKDLSKRIPQLSPSVTKKLINEDYIFGLS